MNILFTSDLSGLGGGETSLLNLCIQIKNEHSVSVICAHKGKLVDELKRTGIICWVFDYRDKAMILDSISRIRKILKEQKIDIIHSNDPLTSVIFHYAALGLPVNNYWTCHGQWYDFNPIKRILIKNANKYIFCVSTAVKNSLKKTGFNKLGVTYLGIPIEKYINAEASDLRTELNISHQEILIAVIGRFQAIKGQMKAAEAIHKLLDDGINLRCLFIGGCIYNNAEEKKYYESVRQYVNFEKLEKYIKFTGERNDIPKILKEIDILLIPSDNESFGMVAIEALASGTTVLSTPNDGVSEILNNNSDLISKTNDSQGLYLLVKNYLNSYDVQKRTKEFIENRYKDFDIELIARSYLDIFSRKG